MKKAAIVALLLALLIACTSAPPKKHLNETQAPQNVSLGAELGDLLSINFALSLENGTVVRTNNETLAKENNLATYLTGPFTFILGQSGEVIGFDSALLGAHVGEHKEILIPPSEKELILSTSRTKTIPRLIEVNRFQSFPEQLFKKTFGKNPTPGITVYNDTFAFKYKVINITDGYVITKMILNMGESYVLTETQWKSKVINLTEDSAIFFQNPQQNQTITTPLGPARVTTNSSKLIIRYEPELGFTFNKSMTVAQGFDVKQQFQVIDVKPETFTIKRIGILTDKRLILQADILDITKNVKEVKSDTVKPLIKVKGQQSN